MAGVFSIRESLDLEYFSKRLFALVQTISESQEQAIEQLDLHPDCGDCLEVACAMALLLHDRAGRLDLCKRSDDNFAYIKSQIEVSLLIRVHHEDARHRNHQGKGALLDLVHASASFGERFVGLDRAMDNLAVLWQEKDEADDREGRDSQHYEIRTYSIDDLIAGQGEPLVQAMSGMLKNHDNSQPLLRWSAVLGLKDHLESFEQSMLVKQDSPGI